MISIPFRAQLALMAVGRYAYGNHVTDPAAHRARMMTLHRQSWTTPTIIKSDPERAEGPRDFLVSPYIYTSVL